MTPEMQLKNTWHFLDLGQGFIFFCYLHSILCRRVTEYILSLKWCIVRGVNLNSKGFW